MYLISTERQNEKQLIALLSFEVDGFFLSHGIGYFEGQAEESTVIQLADSTIDKRTGERILYNGVKRIATLIAREFDQQAVLVTVTI
jgi:hypothetical protein